MANEPAAHAEAHTLVASFLQRAPDMAWVLKLAGDLHQSGASRFEKPLAEEHLQTIVRMNFRGDPKPFFYWLLERVDLTVSP
jgi:hypothetical protein